MRHTVALCTLVSAMVAALWTLSAASPSAKTTAAHGAVKLVAARGVALPGRWQAWADASRMPTPKGRIRVRFARCPALPHAAGCVYTHHPRTIYLRLSAGDPRGTILHELGHTFDLLVMSNRDRAGVSRIFDRAQRAWWKGRIPTASSAR